MKIFEPETSKHDQKALLLRQTAVSSVERVRGTHREGPNREHRHTYLSGLLTDVKYCCIRCGPDEERILDIVPREGGARNSG